MVKAVKARKNIKNLTENGDGLRRSGRQHHAPERDNNFVMCSSTLDHILGYDDQDQIRGIKRRRNYRRNDDSDEYIHGVRRTRRKVHRNNSLIEILEWRHQLNQAPLRIFNEQILKKNQHFDEVIHYSKNIAYDNLEKYGTNIQAIFINIIWQNKLESLKNLKNLQLNSKKLMKKGLIFLWTPKQYLFEILNIMQKKDFNYVENLQVINLSYNKIKQQYKNKHEIKQQTEIITLQNMLHSLSQVDPNIFLQEKQSCFFKSSKLTLLIFRKNSPDRIQLRHQRTCDVVFDIIDEDNHNSIELKHYIYNMIETLLPDCLDINIKDGKYQWRMMQLWAQQDTIRRGWIHIIQK